MLRTVARLSVLVLGVVVADAHASHYESCDLQAELVAVSELPGARRYDMELNVRVASAARGTRDLNYIDCRQYEGRTLRVQLQVPSWKGEPRAGDTVVFNRLVATGITDEGEGDFECLRLRELRKLRKPVAPAR